MWKQIEALKNKIRQNYEKHYLRDFFTYIFVGGNGGDADAQFKQTNTGNE